jgi:hypothetical protein
LLLVVILLRRFKPEHHNRKISSLPEHLLKQLRRTSSAFDINPNIADALAHIRSDAVSRAAAL